MRWLAVLDMDGTILKRRTVDVLCEKLGLLEELREIDRESKNKEAHEVSARIAELFSGIEASRLEEIFDTINLVEGVREFMKFLKSNNFVTVIVTDSYSFLATRLARRLGMDAVKGNELEIANGVVTGRITMPLGWERERRKNCQKKAVCKLNAMKNLMGEYSIPQDRTLAVGDSVSDACLVERARIGVAFRPKDKYIIRVADVVIKTDFHDLLKWLEGFL